MAEPAVASRLVMVVGREVNFEAFPAEDTVYFVYRGFTRLNKRGKFWKAAPVPNGALHAGRECRTPDADFLNNARCDICHELALRRECRPSPSASRTPPPDSSVPIRRLL